VSFGEAPIHWATTRLPVRAGFLVSCCLEIVLAAAGVESFSVMSMKLAEWGREVTASLADGPGAPALLTLAQCGGRDCQRRDHGHGSSGRQHRRLTLVRILLKSSRRPTSPTPGNRFPHPPPCRRAAAPRSSRTGGRLSAPRAPRSARRTTSRWHQRTTQAPGTGISEPGGVCRSRRELSLAWWITSELRLRCRGLFLWTSLPRSYFFMGCRSPSNEGECRARGGTRTAFQAPETLGTRGNMRNPARSAPHTTRSEAQSVYFVHSPDSPFQGTAS